MARAPLRAGDPGRIGHYRLTARLGSGGMGVVYLGIGWDGTQVAVKVLRPELADDPEFRHRFRREVSALMRVRGLCTVRVIEAHHVSKTYARGVYAVRDLSIPTGVPMPRPALLCARIGVIRAPSIGRRDVESHRLFDRGAY